MQVGICQRRTASKWLSVGPTAPSVRVSADRKIYTSAAARTAAPTTSCPTTTT